MTEVSLSKAPNPQLLTGCRSIGCPLLRVCVHYCVCALGWVKCRAQIPKYGSPYLATPPLPFPFFSFHKVQPWVCVCLQWCFSSCSVRVFILLVSDKTMTHEYGNRMRKQPFRITLFVHYEYVWSTKPDNTQEQLYPCLSLNTKATHSSTEAPPRTLKQQQRRTVTLCLLSAK